MAPDSPPQSTSADAAEKLDTISSLAELARFVDYSFMDSLAADPDANAQGIDYAPRQVFSGHYVPVAPTPIENPVYISHSKTLFGELGLDDELATSPEFTRLFSGDLSDVPAPMRNTGWATGYALSIFGTEYYQQCPFQTGNGYGDGRAISALEVVLNGKRWEMQLKGGGRTPYCRGADGRAVLRSSVREFLAQESMNALGIPTSRSLSLYVSETEKVQRPWYSEQSRSREPDMLAEEAVAISTRVASSFIRVGQIELFGRRARKNEHADALKELEQIVLHLIDREYASEIDDNLPLQEKVIQLAQEFRGRLTRLVANWMRVGYCQGNFNSDNCAAGGFTLDYGPFGFCEVFNPYFQPWTGGGEHFAFWNQPAAAQRNFESFCTAVRPLLESSQPALQQLDEINSGFTAVMQTEFENMWSAKLGLDQFDVPLVQELVTLMMKTKVDYTIFFRELSSIPESIDALKKSFYGSPDTELQALWEAWLKNWKTLVDNRAASLSLDKISEQMKRTNPKYILREWLLAEAYQQAAAGNYDVIRQLQDVIAKPFDEQSSEIEEKYYRLRPSEFSDLGGISQMSCSS